MKKRKLNLSKLTLNKDVISSLTQEKILGGATVEQTCRRSCNGSCLCPSVIIECVTQWASCHSCIFPVCLQAR
ncbi:class I lanthipeptide [Chitinophaga qingshengii]|uniref:Class I lanthipeptide n=1 Tax=Chitinophaga qingshengii TaxID=1569794 RepID=A0ABR7TV73_9BACT|nr:class I lanthipeptide [Chitinophaga qingshengii]MBC9933522.1 class I lanthipeptide [Chitinophaga qingshengii]